MDTCNLVYLTVICFMNNLTSSFSMVKIIPSIFTSVNLLCGFMAIVIGDHYIGVLLLLVATVMDALDGIAARMLNAQSEIGKELDSLADLVSFGLAPAYLYLQLSPADGWISIVPACILVASSALRLAIFNTKPSKPYFEGLPTPASAFFLVGIFLGHHYQNEHIMNLLGNKTIYLSVALFLSMMMLSKIRMFSLKKINQGFKANRLQLLTFVIFLTLLISNFEIAIPLTVVIYIFLSIINSRFGKKLDELIS